MLGEAPAGRRRGALPEGPPRAARGRRRRSRSAERRRRPPPCPLEELVEGMRVENERGEFFLVETAVHLEVRHGDVPLSRFHAIEPSTVVRPHRRAGPRGLRPAARGLPRHRDDGPRRRGGNRRLPDRRRLGGRRALPRAAVLHARLPRGGGAAPRARGGAARFDRLVTFNGKMFDVPLLDARFRLNRGRFPLAEAPHLDLLHPARRLWKARLESCRLQSLEAGLMGLRRTGDIPGEEIPQVYFDWVRRRDARMLARVFEHNRQDIVSLAALAVLACQWVEEGRAEDPRDVYSLARVLERARLYDRSEAEYRRALDLGPGALRGPRSCASPGAPSGRGSTSAPRPSGPRRGRRARWRAGASWPCTTSTGRGTWTGARRGRARDAARRAGAPPRRARLAPGRGLRAAAAAPAAEAGEAADVRPSRARGTGAREGVRSPAGGSRRGPGSRTGFLKTAMPDFSKAGMSGECA